MQTGIVIFIIVVSLGYAGWRIYQSLTRKTNPCSDCAGCSLKGKIKAKEQCPSNALKHNTI